MSISIKSAVISTPNGAADIKYTEWGSDTFRLIPSRFPPISVYEPLVPEDRIGPLVNVENLTNPRLRIEGRLREDGEASPARIQNWNLAPFAYINPEGSRFFDPWRPCLELAADRQTALAMSVARRERFLARTEEPPIDIDMRMLVTPLRGARLVDLRGLPPDLPEAARREAGKMVPDDADGILFRPPERPTGTCVGVLRGPALGRTVQSTHYRYAWNGRRIAKLYAFDQEGVLIEPESLSQEAYVLAA